MQTKAVGARGSTSSRPPAAFGSLRWRAGPHARPVRGVGPRDAEANGPTATCYTEAMRGLSLLGLALPAGCSAAGGDLEASLDGGAPALALGTGEAAFEPVAEGGELELPRRPDVGLTLRWPCGAQRWRFLFAVELRYRPAHGATCGVRGACDSCGRTNNETARDALGARRRGRARRWRGRSVGVRVSAPTRVLVFGASGRTGRRVVAAAVERGLHVAVFVRDAARAPREAHEVHVGDVCEAEAVHGAVRAGDLLISALGGAPGEAQGGVVREGGRHLAAAARARGAARLLGVVGAGVLQLDAARQRHQADDYPAMFRAIGAEHEALHRSFCEAGLWWALVCTPRLVDAAPTGHLVRCDDYLPPGRGEVTTGDVAALLLDLATDPAARPGRVGVNTP